MYTRSGEQNLIGMIRQEAPVKVQIGVVQQTDKTINTMKVTLRRSGRAITCSCAPDVPFVKGDHCLVLFSTDMERPFAIAWTGGSDVSRQPRTSLKPSERNQKSTAPTTPPNVRTYTTPLACVVYWRPVFEDHNIWYVVQRATDASGTGAQTLLVTQGSVYINTDKDYTHYRVAAAAVKGSTIATGSWSSWTAGSFQGYVSQIAIEATNKAGRTVRVGDVVVFSDEADTAFDMTNTPGITDNVPAVVLDDTIAADADGNICISGYVAQCNIDSASVASIASVPASAARLEYLKTSKRLRNADITDTLSAGCFGMTLGTGYSPPALLFGLPKQ